MKAVSVSLDAKSRPGEFEPSASGSLVNISHEGAMNGNGNNAGESEDTDSRPQGEIEQYLSQQVGEVIIPSYSAWFDMADIHDVSL